MFESPENKVGAILVGIAFVLGSIFGGLGAGILAGVFIYAIYAIILAVQGHVESQSEQQSAEDNRAAMELKRQLLGEDSEPAKTTTHIEGNEIVGNDGAFASSLRFYPENSCFILYDQLAPKPAREFQIIGEQEYIFNNKEELVDFIRSEKLDFFSRDGEEWMSGLALYQFDSAEKMYKNEFYAGKSTWSESEILERRP